MKQSKRIISLALLIWATQTYSFAAEPTKPNIVFILADDLGYMDVGCYNPKTFYETPNIDRLAKRGMMFTQAYAACCVCSPTRASIMTGKYPPRYGITNFIGGSRAGKLLPAPNASELPFEEVTIAESATMNEVSAKAGGVAEKMAELLAKSDKAQELADAKGRKSQLGEVRSPAQPGEEKQKPVQHQDQSKWRQRQRAKKRDQGMEL